MGHGSQLTVAHVTNRFLEIYEPTIYRSPFAFELEKIVAASDKRAVYRLAEHSARSAVEWSIAEWATLEALAESLARIWQPEKLTPLCWARIKELAAEKGLRPSEVKLGLVAVAILEVLGSPTFRQRQRMRFHRRWVKGREGLPLAAWSADPPVAELYPQSLLPWWFMRWFGRQVFKAAEADLLEWQTPGTERSELSLDERVVGIEDELEVTRHDVIGDGARARDVEIAILHRELAERARKIATDKQWRAVEKRMARQTLTDADRNALYHLRGKLKASGLQSLHSAL